MKCLVVLGTRPEAIKMACLIKRLQANQKIECSVCCTAQHREMLDPVLRVFDLRPDYDLNIMERNQNLSEITTRTLDAIGGVLDAARPSAVFVQGDTTTSMAAALAAFYRKIPVHHVEAGLRTCRRYSPFPEEINRQLTARLASVHYAPTNRARDHLLREGISPENIFVTGNTVVDALMEVMRKIEASPQLPRRLEQEIRQCGYPIAQRKYILVTGHRRENFGPGLEHLCRALTRIARQHPDIDIVYPVHLNPNVQGAVKEHIAGLENLYLLPPLDYLAFVYLMTRSLFIITDSGGIQEEAPSIGKPVLVTRDATERPEGVATGCALLVGASDKDIYDAAFRLLTDDDFYNRSVATDNPYGDGQAAARIEAALIGNFA